MPQGEWKQKTTQSLFRRFEALFGWSPKQHQWHQKLQRPVLILKNNIQTYFSTHKQCYVFRWWLALCFTHIVKSLSPTDHQGTGAFQTVLDNSFVQASTLKSKYKWKDTLLFNSSLCFFHVCLHTLPQTAEFLPTLQEWSHRI